MLAKIVYQIPVKMGSNKIQMDFTKEELKSMTNVKLIKSVLRKLFINDKLAKTYVVFESVHGVERLLGDSEDFQQLFDEYKDQKCDVQFVIRKCHRMEEKLLKQNDLKSKSMSRKCYKKLRISQQSQERHTENRQLLNIVPISIERDYATRALQDESKLNQRLNTQDIAFDHKEIQTVADTIEESLSDKSTIKLSNLNQNELSHNLNHKFTQNIKFLQSLYLKIKKGGEKKSFKGYLAPRSSYQKLNETNSCGSSEESDDFDRQSSKTTTSTSTLDSLV